MTAKEIIVVSLTAMVTLVITVPIICASIGALWYGKAIAGPEFAKTAGDIVIYVLGIVSGYVLNNTKSSESPPKA